ncbi:phospholipid/cholesterol/gamma-HCH transport system ATP-binding protein [Marinospirillum celere]|uniref:Phospholipid/cholesterol/gamma-HCH transport system ATP-binding protein n=1 Tax=Marinospirillum celere TaxID=1122252 RepID=A0A1I1EK91_9GAMM|nr:ATP-binding cassette domain-containing protein [Marinospirillum celere]SFB85888.1 phospholipid/cholesterol/gamma-HCH transport system ATP-binding protein [Marinospirillum celere]
MDKPSPIIELSNIKTRFGMQRIHQNLNLQVLQGERLALVGGSGCGKSVLLSELALLTEPEAGNIKLFGQNVKKLSTAELKLMRTRMGMMFQQGALFTSLSLLENVMLPLREHQKLPESLLKELAMLKIQLVGLPTNAAHKLPQELSGGMLKRAAVARALALDPNLLLLDEPTAGLDPASASAFDELILDLHAKLDLTLILVTHDLDSLWRVTDQVAFIGRKRVLAKEPMKTLINNQDPDISHYFANTRANRAMTSQLTRGETS